MKLKAMAGAAFIAFVGGILVALVIAIGPGCVSAPNGNPPTTQQIADQLAMDVSDTVGAAIIISKDSGATARKIEAIATQVVRAVDAGVNIRDVATRVVVEQAEDKELAQYLVNLFFNRVKRNLGIDLTAVEVPAGQLDAVRSIIRASALSARDTAHAFTSRAY